MRKFFISLFICIYFGITTSLTFAQTTSNISVSASVNPHASDFILSIQNDATGELAPGDLVNYTVAYRSSAPNSLPVELVAGWDKGIVVGTPSNQIETLEYVVGSAITSSEGAIPIVNLNNNTIHWNINSLDPSVNSNTVQFTLRVKNPIPYDISLTNRVYIGGTFVALQLTPVESSITVRGLPNPTATPTPIPTETPTPTLTPLPTIPLPTSKIISPTSTPGPGPSATPMPKINISPTQKIISVVQKMNARVSISAVNDTSATMRIIADTKFKYLYTLSKCNSQVGESKEGIENKSDHTLTITSLQSGTTYCVNIILTSEKSEERVSQVFSFTTSKALALYTIRDFVIHWYDLPIFSMHVPFVLLPTSSLIKFTIPIDQSKLIESLIVQVQNDSVLSATSSRVEYNRDSSDLKEVIQGIFSGNLKLPDVVGKYRIQIIAKDIYGGSSTMIIPGYLILRESIQIVDKSNNQPIEGAKLNIKYLNQKTKKYIDFNSSFRLSNAENQLVPDYNSDNQGKVLLPLIEGEYKLTVVAPRYKTLEKSIFINENNQLFPILEMESQNSIYSIYKDINSSILKVSDYVSSQSSIIFSSLLARNAFAFFMGVVLLIVEILDSLREKTTKRSFFGFQAEFREVLNIVDKWIDMVFWTLSFVCVVGFLLFSGILSIVPFLLLMSIYVWSGRVEDILKWSKHKFNK
ncbi:MAG: hypothetical protein WCO06_03630 [Candidatus Roizmanbacteria bacterium]